jgi:hypothetical protein
MIMPVLPEMRSVLARSPNVAYAVLEGEGVIYHLRQDEILVFNPTATLIWEAFDGSRTLEEMAVDFARLFDVPREAIMADVLATARDLFTRELVLDVTVTEEGRG